MMHLSSLGVVRRGVYSRVRVVSNNLIGGASLSGAVTTEVARGSGVTVNGVEAIEPEHLRVVIGPDGHDQDVFEAEGVLHCGPSTDLVVAVVVVKDAEENVTELGVDLAALRKALPGGGGNVNAGSILNEELVQAIGLKLGDDTE